MTDNYHKRQALNVTFVGIANPNSGFGAADVKGGEVIMLKVLLCIG